MVQLPIESTRKHGRDVYCLSAKGRAAPTIAGTAPSGRDRNDRQGGGPPSFRGARRRAGITGLTASARGHEGPARCRDSASVTAEKPTQSRWTSRIVSSDSRVRRACRGPTSPVASGPIDTPYGDGLKERRGPTSSTAGRFTSWLRAWASATSSLSEPEGSRAGGGGV